MTVFIEDDGAMRRVQNISFVGETSRKFKTRMRSSSHGEALVASVIGKGNQENLDPL